MEVRQRDGAIRGERDALDAGRQAIAKPAEPSAADGAIGCRRRPPRRQVVEKRERVVGVPATRTGSEPTIAPPPAQRAGERNGIGSSPSASITWAGDSSQSSGTRVSVAAGDAKVGLIDTPPILYELVQ